MLNKKNLIFLGGPGAGKGTVSNAMIAKYGEDIRGGLTFLAEHMCFDIFKAVNELGWEPEYSVTAAVAENAREFA